jgi:hypothetical protein
VNRLFLPPLTTIAYLLGCLLFSGALHAAPVAIDFEAGSVTQISGSPQPQYLSYGYTLTASEPTDVAEGIGSIFVTENESPDSYLFMINNGMDLERADGGAFSLLQFDGLERYVLAYGCNTPILEGTTLDGSTISYHPSKACSGEQWVTNTLSDPAWSQLVKVTFSPYIYNGQYEGYIDNIVVSNVVPIPPAVILFGSALLGLAGWRKRISANK